MKTWTIIGVIMVSLISGPWCWAQQVDSSIVSAIHYDYNRLKEISGKIEQWQDDIKMSGWMVWLVEENAERAGYWYGATQYWWGGRHFSGPYWGQRVADEFTRTVTDVVAKVKRYNQFVRFYNRTRRELISELQGAFPDSTQLPKWAQQPLPDEYPTMDLSPPKTYLKDGDGK